MPAPLQSAEPLHTIELVDLASPCLNDEARRLFHARLRAAAMMLGGSTLTFLVWRWLVHAEGESALTLIHGLVTALLLMASALLWSRECMPWPKLRALEVFVFGLPAAFVLLLQHQEMVTHLTAVRNHNPIVPWVIFIFIKSVLIPSERWTSAVPITAAFAISPLLLTAVLMTQHSELQEAVGWVGLIEMSLEMGIVATTAMIGLKRFGDLRQRAEDARRFGQYQLREKIGEGGMGEVYRAEHILLKRPCAIKVMREVPDGDPRAIDRFEREVQATAGLSHWNTISIFDFGRANNGTFYYVMELLEPGLSLEEVLDFDGPLPPARVIHILAQVCSALAEAHSLGLIHRDIKPNNIILTQRGGLHDVVKLVDFGLVKPIEAMTTPRSSRLTEAGMVVGTPLFMSPEQAMGSENIDGRADLYSLSAAAWLLLTGHALFERDTPMATLIAHIQEPAPLLRDLAPGLPDDLLQILQTGLQKRPEDRPENAWAMREALLECHGAWDWTEAEAKSWWTAWLARPDKTRGRLALARAETEELQPSSPSSH